MEPNTEMVDEVVVVAYGVRKKGTIAGSVSTVKAEKMENVPAASFDQALQGQALQVQGLADGQGWGPWGSLPRSSRGWCCSSSA